MSTKRGCPGVAVLGSKIFVSGGEHEMFFYNKLKSLKVAQVKDEMDDDEDDGCDVVMVCVMSHGDVVL